MKIFYYLCSEISNNNKLKDMKGYGYVSVKYCKNKIRGSDFSPDGENLQALRSRLR